LDDIRGHGGGSNLVERCGAATSSRTGASELMRALSWLGLVDPSGGAGIDLLRLAKAADRREGFQHLVRSHYGRAAEVIEAGTTRTDLEDAFDDGRGHQTRRRSIAFFLALAKAAGFDTSIIERPQRRSPSTAQDDLSRANPAARSDRNSDPYEDVLLKAMNVLAGHVDIDQQWAKFDSLARRVDSLRTAEHLS